MPFHPSSRSIPAFLPRIVIVSWWTLLLTVCMLIVTVAPPLVFADSQLHRDALYDFFIKTKGPLWSSSCRGGWNIMTSTGAAPTANMCDRSTSPFSSYYGLTCSAQNGQITKIVLNSCGLSGSLSPLLAVISTLQQVRLETNKLRGTLPREWGATWTLITDLRLHENELQGTLPPEWSGMTSLQYVHLYQNHFIGALPVSWQTSWRSIQKVSFCTISCTGEVGVNAACTKTSPNSCIVVTVWYNCLNVNALPPTSGTNTWNWGDTAMAFGPQRRNCILPSFTTSPSRPAATGSATVSAMAHSSSPSQSLSLPASTSHSTSAATASPTATRSLTATAPSSSRETTASGSVSSSPSDKTFSSRVTTSDATVSPTRTSNVSLTVSTGTQSSSPNGSSITRTLRGTRSDSATPCSVAPLTAWTMTPPELRSIPPLIHFSTSSSAPSSSTVAGPSRNRTVVRAVAMTWSPDGLLVTIPSSQFLSQHCVTISLAIVQGFGWRFTSSSSSSSADGESNSNNTWGSLQLMQGMSRMVQEADLRVMQLHNDTFAVAWLCSSRPFGFSLYDSLWTRLWISVAAPLQCEGHRAVSDTLTVAVQFPVVAVGATSQAELLKSAKGRGSLVARTLATISMTKATARVIPILQRVGGSGCNSSEVDEGLFPFFITTTPAHSIRAQHVGVVLGNLFFVFVGWVAVSLVAVGIAKLVHRQKGSWLDCIRKVHVASLWLPFAGLVAVPIVTSSVALVLGVSSSSSRTLPLVNHNNYQEDEEEKDVWWTTMIGVFGIIAALFEIAVLLWIGFRAKSLLVVRRFQRDDEEDEDAKGGRTLMDWILRWWWRLKYEHWVIRGDRDEEEPLPSPPPPSSQLLPPEAEATTHSSHPAISTDTALRFKRHTQIVLEEATVWWHPSLDAVFAFAVGFADGAGKAVNTDQSCVVSTLVGPCAQLTLLAVVLWRRPHGEYVAHWSAVVALAATGLAGLLQMFAITLNLNADANSSTTPLLNAPLLQSITSLLLIGGAPTLALYFAQLFSVAQWVRKVRRQRRHLPQRQDDTSSTMKKWSATDRCEKHEKGDGCVEDNDDPLQQQCSVVAAAPVSPAAGDLPPADSANATKEEEEEHRPTTQSKIVADDDDDDDPLAPPVVEVDLFYVPSVGKMGLLVAQRNNEAEEEEELRNDAAAGGSDVLRRCAVTSGSNHHHNNNGSEDPLLLLASWGTRKTSQVQNNDNVGGVGEGEPQPTLTTEPRNKSDLLFARDEHEAETTQDPVLVHGVLQQRQNEESLNETDVASLGPHRQHSEGE